MRSNAYLSVPLHTVVPRSLFSRAILCMEQRRDKLQRMFRSLLGTGGKCERHRPKSHSKHNLHESTGQKICTVQGDKLHTTGSS